MTLLPVLMLKDETDLGFQPLTFSFFKRRNLFHSGQPPLKKKKFPLSFLSACAFYSNLVGKKVHINHHNQLFVMKYFIQS